MKKYILILLCVFSVHLSLHSQVLNQNILNNVAPQAPEVFNLARYTYYPVSHTTGTVNTEIPIYTIKTKQLELPISLSYHNSGIKVNDIAGSVGLGWVLNAGGILSIRGGSSYGFLNTFKYYDLEKGDLDTQIKAELGTLPNDNSRIYDAINSLYQGRNTQAELFTYNIPGHISGQFLFDSNGKPKQIPLTDNKIEQIRNNPSGSGIKITASNGVQYYFNKYKVESKKMSQLIGMEMTPAVSITTGVYLNKIVSADNQDSIVFMYKQLDTYFSVGSMMFSAQKTTTRDLGFLFSPKVEYSVIPQSPSTGISDWMLEKIIFNGGEVVFTSEKDRKDIFPERISDITVYQGGESGRKSAILSCELLNNDYFISDDLERRPKMGKLFHRLKLSGINILPRTSSIRGEASQQYRFYYNPMKLPYYDDPNNLDRPKERKNTGCYAQDLWGYYNGKGNPHLAVFNGNISINDFYEMWGCGYVNPNREVSEKHAKAWSLEKISYPSGGYVVFDLESNRDDEGFLKAGLRIKRQHLYDRNHNLLEDRQYEYKSAVELMSEKDIIGYFNYKTKLIIENTNPSTDIYNEVYQSESASPNNTPSSQIYYAEVIEYQGGSILNEGKTVYKYNYGSDDHYFSLGGGNMYSRFSQVLIDGGWTRGFLSEEQYYKKINNDYTLVKKKINNFRSYLNETLVTGLLIYKDVTWVHNYTWWKANDYIREEFHWYNTYASTGAIKQIGSTTTLYDDSGKEVSTTETMDYDKISAKTNPHQNVTKKMVQLSDGSTDITRYYYPLDYISGATSFSAYKINEQFRDANIVSIPFEQVKLKKSGTSELAYGGEFYEYEGINRLKTISELHTSTLVNYTGATAIGANGYNKSPLYTTKYTVSYDDYNNIKEIVDQSGLSTSYLWSYNSLYPVAEIKNATSAQVTEALQKVGLKYNDLVKTSTPNIQKIKTLTLPNAYISTFSFDPFVGVTSITEPNGTGLNYTYDSFNRLASVKDDNSSIVAAYKYNINSSSVPIFMQADQNYIQYRKGSATIDIENVSTNSLFEWTLSDNTNKVLFQGTSKDFEFIPTQTGELILKCVVSGGSLKKSEILTRTILVKSPPEMGVSQIGASSYVHVDGKSTHFGINVIEGSLEYSYQWTTSFKGKTQTGTNSYFSAIFEEEGTAEITCAVKDVKLGKTVTRKFTITILPPIPVAFSVGLFNNVVGRKSTIGYWVDENTGSGREYIWNGWTVKTPSGTKTSKDKSYVFDLLEYGTYTFTGSLTDPYNGYTKTVTGERQIIKTLFFDNIEQVEADESNNYTAKASAVINTVEDITVTFKINASRRNNSKNNSIIFTLDGNTRVIQNGISDPYSDTVVLTLKKGVHKFGITHPLGYEDTKLEVSSITITGVPTGYEIGEAGTGYELVIRTQGRGNMY